MLKYVFLALSILFGTASLIFAFNAVTGFNPYLNGIYILAFLFCMFLAGCFAVLTDKAFFSGIYR